VPECGAAYFDRWAGNNVLEEGNTRLHEDGSRRSLATPRQNKWRQISKDCHRIFTSVKTSNHTQMHEIETGNKLNMYDEDSFIGLLSLLKKT